MDGPTGRTYGLRRHTNFLMWCCILAIRLDGKYHSVIERAMVSTAANYDMLEMEKKKNQYQCLIALELEIGSHNKSLDKRHQLNNP